MPRLDQEFDRSRRIAYIQRENSDLLQELEELVVQDDHQSFWDASDVVDSRDSLS
jgi:hypothetical protein